MGLLLERLETALAAARPDYLEELAPGLTPSELEAVEQKLGLGLPEAAHRFFQWRDGQARDYDGTLWHDWRLMDADLIVDTRCDLNGRLAGGSFD